MRARSVPAVLLAGLVWSAVGSAGGASAAGPPVIQASGLRIELSGAQEALWRIAPLSAAPAVAFAPPVFPLDGRLVRAVPIRLESAGEPVWLGGDLLEYRYRGVLRADPSLAIEVRLRVSDLSPILRFQYRLLASKPHVWSGAPDEIEWLATSFAGLPRATEAGGPMLAASDGRRTLLVSYEHGSQATGVRLRFDLGKDRSLRLRGAKARDGRGRRVDAEHPFESGWLHAGLVAGDLDRAADAYRSFVAEELSADAEARR